MAAISDLKDEGAKLGAAIADASGSGTNPVGVAAAATTDRDFPDALDLVLTGEAGGTVYFGGFEAALRLAALFFLLPPIVEKN